MEAVGEKPVVHIGHSEPRHFTHDNAPQCDPEAARIAREA